MIKVGQVVKLKKAKKKGEVKRRWRVMSFPPSEITMPNSPHMSPPFQGIDITHGLMMTTTTTFITKSTGIPYGTVVVRRLDTATHRLERNNQDNLVPVPFWERIWRRY